MQLLLVCMPVRSAGAFTPDDDRKGEGRRLDERRRERDENGHNERWHSGSGSAAHASDKEPLRSSHPREAARDERAPRADNGRNHRGRDEDERK
jgi:hypothetical protein